MVTKDDIKLIKEELTDTFATKKDLEAFATKKDLEAFATKKDLKKMKKEIIGAIANISLNSPTINQFNDLEKRVSRLEASAN